MGKYNLLSPKMDIIFKALFGGNDPESKTILIGFLNSVLDSKENIVDIVELNPYNDKEYVDDKLSIMDIKVKTDKDELIDIEIQLAPNTNFRKRSLYYWSKLYGETIKSGKDYLNLKKCMVISIVDFDLIKESSKAHTVFKIKEVDENFELIDDLEIHYLEMGKFVVNKENQTELERWISFIKSAGTENEDECIDKVKNESEVISMAVNKLMVLSSDEKKRQEYYAREKAILDEKSRASYAENLAKQSLEQGLKQGIEQGMQKGMQKGAMKEKIENIRVLTEQGLPMETIQMIARLPIDEILKIQKQFKS